jgi:hypothetical protein
MTIPPEPPKRSKTPPKPKSAAEIIERLSTVSVPGKTVSAASVHRLFRTKSRMPTSASEREALRDQLRVVDPTWEVRAAIVTHGYPELAPASTATLGYDLAIEARQVTAYPSSGLADAIAIQRWIDTLWRANSRPGARVMPWIALVALWPDRHLPGFARSLGTLISGPISNRRATSAPPIEQLGADLTEAPKGARLLGEVNSIIQPFAESDSRISELEGELEAALKRNAATRAEVSDLEQRAASLQAQVSSHKTRADEAERGLTSGLSDAERRLAETAGRASQAHAKTAKTYGPEVAALASDIRMYLDRSEPNVDGALQRVDDLIDLGKRLEAEGS